MATRWEPDTCGCVLEYDEIGPDDKPIWIGVKSCTRHNTPDECLEDNRGINRIIKEAGATEGIRKSVDRATNTFFFEFDEGVNETVKSQVLERLSKDIPRLGRKN